MAYVGVDIDALDKKLENGFTNLGAGPEGHKVQGGNVVIILSKKPQDKLLIPQSILSEASPRFRTRFGSTAFGGGREVVDPGASQKVKVFEYRLAFDEETFMLTDEADSAETEPASTKRVYCKYIGWHDEAIDADSLQRSALSPDEYKWFSGASIRSHRAPVALIRRQSVAIHKILFTLLLAKPFNLSSIDYSIKLFILAEVTALAEYYEFLPSVAPRLSQLFDQVPGVWKEVSEYPRFFLYLSIKLRSENMFDEAIRHIVGQRTIVMSHPPRDDLPPETTALVLRKVVSLHQGMDSLSTSLRTLSLFRYVPNAHLSLKKGREAPVRTTWLEANEVSKDVDGKCHSLAKAIFRETLDARIHGESHHSHIEYDGNSRNGGRVRCGTLRYACEAILAANRNPYTTHLFGKDVAPTYAGIFDLPQTKKQDSAAHIVGSLRALTKNAAESIQHCLPPLAGSGETGLGAHAKFNQGLGYFTYMSFDEDDMPWAEKEEWPGLQLPEFEPASDAWLKVVGLE